MCHAVTARDHADNLAELRRMAILVGNVIIFVRAATHMR
jgi:hypothetical protein